MLFLTINSIKEVSLNAFRSGKKELKQQIQSNQHEVFVVSIDEMDAIVRSSPKGKLPHIKNAWQKIKGKAEVGANHYSSADDLRTLRSL